MDLSFWAYVVPSFARVSAVSLPWMPQWDGIHWRITVCFIQRRVMLDIRLFRSVSLPVCTAWRTDRASERKSTLWDRWGYSQYGLPLLLEPRSLLCKLWSTDQLQSWVYRLCNLGTLHIHPLRHCVLRPLLGHLWRCRSRFPWGSTVEGVPGWSISSPDHSVSLWDLFLVRRFWQGHVLLCSRQGSQGNWKSFGGFVPECLCVFVQDICFGGQSFPSIVFLSLADTFFFHWMTAEPFEFGSLCEQLLLTAIQKGLQSSNSLQLLYGCRPHGSVMMRAAWFWTLVILSILVSSVVPHAAMPYSRTGLTLPVCLTCSVYLSPHPDNITLPQHQHLHQYDFYNYSLLCLSQQLYFPPPPPVITDHLPSPPSSTPKHLPSQVCDEHGVLRRPAERWFHRPGWRLPQRLLFWPHRHTRHLIRALHRQQVWPEAAVLRMRISRRCSLLGDLDIGTLRRR